MDPSLFMHDLPDNNPHATRSDQAQTFSTARFAEQSLERSSWNRVGTIALSATTFIGAFVFGSHAFSVEADTRWEKDEIIASRRHNAKDLLPEMWNKIAGFLDSKSLAKFGSTCIAMHDMLRKQRLERINNGALIRGSLDDFINTDFFLLNRHSIQYLRIWHYGTPINTKIAKLFPNLTHIALREWSMITKAEILALATHCKKLTYINIHGACITREATTVLQHCKKLTYLNLSTMKQFTYLDASIVPIAQHCTELKKVYLRGTHITDQPIITFATQCNKLTHIDLSHCNITDASLLALAEHCKKLDYIGLRWTDVTDRGIIALATHCTNLTYVNLKGCHNISNTAKNILRQKGIRVED